MLCLLFRRTAPGLTSHRAPGEHGPGSGRKGKRDLHLVYILPLALEHSLSVDHPKLIHYWCQFENRVDFPLRTRVVKVISSVNFSRPPPSSDRSMNAFIILPTPIDPVTG